MPLSDPASFLSLGKALGARLAEVRKSPSTLLMLQEVVKACSPFMAVEDLKKLESSVTAAHAERLKAAASTKKKTGGAKLRGTFATQQVAAHREDVSGDYDDSMF